MSDYKTELQYNNVDLQSVLETVRGLPEAGGGNTPDTGRLTLHIEALASSNISVYPTRFVNGKVVVDKMTYNVSSDTDITINDVVKGSYVTIHSSYHDTWFMEATATDGCVIEKDGMNIESFGGLPTFLILRLITTESSFSFGIG